MPRNMAMERPHTRIISVEFQHQIPRPSPRFGCLKDLRVAPLGIDGVDGAVPFADAFGYDPEIVTVEVHGVGGGDFVVQDDADGGVGAEIVDVGVERVGCVSLVGEEEERVAVLSLVFMFSVLKVGHTCSWL